ncbi:MFS transporter [Burkholderia thailandensis]|uniref:Major Facilitator Superfamily protein n=2 Tax=Burkholderia thailandensis TaxID=57975 RepID=A0AAW9D4D6_BURTH|nr:MFS transporter [Burkholderia thailandensis]MCS3391654.1 MFS transporter [Burkholderia thailandensis]MCS6424957.1 MFS transporter [Burkholderia thailandensis]MCS6452689.1 MFS transporter [Burkholderia thailandensis]MCS6464390.1 MFS transporter [Burkholderia thailandensis]MCS6482125.1 MFS transporter [Burkholderia thailandensis]
MAIKTLLQAPAPPGAAPSAGAPDFTRGALAALIAFAAITPLLLLVAPAVAGQLGAQLGLSASQIGAYFFVELGAFSAATLPSYLWLGRVDARRVAWCATAVFCAGNLATAAWMPGFAPLLALRAATALGGGTLMVLCMTSAAASGNRDRVYGLWVVGQLIAGAAGLFLLPHLFGAVGLRALYAALAALALCAAPLANRFPAMPRVRTRHASHAHRDAARASAALAIGAVLTFYLAIGGVWTFASKAAATVGFDAQTSGNVLAIASLMGIAGAALASYLGGRAARRAMLLAGYAILAASLVALAAAPNAAGFAIAIFGFKFAWTFVLPFILASVAAVDTTGRLIATLNLVIGSGLAAGPLVAGLMLDGGGTLRALFSIAAAVSAASLAAMLRVERDAH